MKVTICFDDVKIIVPCGNQTNDEDKLNNNSLKVSDVVENAILRYKKAIGKVNVKFGFKFFFNYSLNLLNNYYLSKLLNQNICIVYFILKSGSHHSIYFVKNINVIFQNNILFCVFIYYIHIYFFFYYFIN